MTLRYDLRINQGETFRLAIPVLDDDGSAASLSGMTAEGQIRTYAGSPTVLYEWSEENFNVAFDGNDVVLTIPATASSLWGFRTGQWALEMSDEDGVVTRLIEGQVIVHPDVVR